VKRPLCPQASQTSMKRPLYPCVHLLKIFPPSLHFSGTPFPLKKLKKTPCGCG